MDSISFPLSSLTFRDTLLVSAGSGLVCHAIFSRFEPRHPLAHVGFLLVAPGLLSLIIHHHVCSFPRAIGLAFSVYMCTLLSSISLYRLSPFHPLAKYPGPIPCKLSKFWMAIIASSGKQHLYYKDLHDKYGSVVRIGPNELSICDPTAVNPMLGPKGLLKGPLWEGRVAEQRVRSLISMRDPKEHSRRRRPWNRGFNTAALKGYEDIIAKRTSQLVSSLRMQIGPVDMSMWISYFTYDFMSDMAFGGGSEMMRQGDIDGLWHMIESGQASALFFGHVPWLGEYYVRLPGLGANLKKFRAFARKRAAIRRAQGSSQKDLFHHLIDEEGVEVQPPTMAEVISDGGLAIVAGSDTTATAISTAVWNLLRTPKAYSKLQAEIDEHITSDEDMFNATLHASMDYLNAVINEALRLHPPVLSGSQRMPEKGSGGKVVGPCFLPEGSSAFIHSYSLQRDPRNFFPMPDAFIPERWLPSTLPGSLHAPEYKGQVIHNTAAFIPFSFGPAMCVGKNLAYQEIRMVLCAMLRKFDMRFVDGFSPEMWESTLQDFFITLKGSLLVDLTPRKHVA